MRRIRGRRKRKYTILIILLSVITIGYASLSQALTINGTSKIDDAKWDVHFENPGATADSNINPTVAPSAPEEDKVTTVSYNVALDQPGDIYEFTIDVVNGGTIDAMIRNYASTIKIGDGEEKDATNSENIPDYLVYTVTYEDGTPIASNHSLAKNTSEKIKVHVEFKKNITNEQLIEAANKNISLKITVNYEQPDENVVSPRG